MAPHSSTLAWKIPWTEGLGRLQSMGSLESDTTEWLHFHFSLSCTGEGNGNTLQCSCLENPRDGGAWWAAVSGVSQSQTWLKRLSSSSSSSFISDWSTTFTAYLPLPVRFFFFFFFIIFIFLILTFSAKRNSFNNYCKAYLILLNPFSFYFSVKLLIAPSNLKITLLGRLFSVVCFFPFIILKLSCHALLTCKVSTENSW